MPKKLPKSTNMNIAKINEKQGFPSLPILSLIIFAINSQANSAINCHLPGIIDFGLTARTIKAVAAATASNIKAEELVKDASNEPRLTGIKV